MREKGRRQARAQHKGEDPGKPGLTPMNRNQELVPNMTNESPTMIAVVGCGYWGPNLIRNFYSLSDCQVKYVCDLDQDRLDHMKRLYPTVTTTADFQDLLDDREVAAIVIATPVKSHFPLAKQCLERGKHILIEKPMAASVEECSILNQLAERGGLKIMVGHTYLYSNVVHRIREIVRSRDLGELLYIASQRLNLGLFQKDINVAWDLAPHDLSIILHVLGETPVAVNCQGKSHITPGIQDISTMWLEFPSGAVATVHSSWLDPNKVRRMTFVGGRRMILYDDTEPREKLKIYDRRVETPPHYDTFAEFHYSYHYGDTFAPHIHQVEPLKAQCEHFLDCVRNGKEPATSGRDGLEIVRILEAASRSMEENGNKQSLL